MVCFRGQKRLGHAQIGLLSGFNSKFPTNISAPFIWETPGITDKGEKELYFVSCNQAFFALIMYSNETFQYWQETSIFTLNILDFNLTLFDGIKYIKRTQMHDITPSHGSGCSNVG